MNIAILTITVVVATIIVVSSIVDYLEEERSWFLRIKDAIYDKTHSLDQRIEYHTIIDSKEKYKIYRRKLKEFEKELVTVAASGAEIAEFDIYDRKLAYAAVGYFSSLGFNSKVNEQPFTDKVIVYLKHKETEEFYR